MSQTPATPAAPETPATPAATPTAPAPGETPKAPTVEELQAELATWKGHARTWETRAGENKAAKEQLDQLEAAKLTEAQRLEKERDDALAKLAAAEASALRSGVAAEKGVPEALLTGSTKEQLEASADALLTFRGPATPPAPPANDAAASGKQGSPVGAGAQITEAELKSMSAADIVAAKKDGRLNHLLGR